jgi:Fur family ferric uptake transcriptional regulator
MNRRNTPAKKKILELFGSSGSALSQDRIEAALNGEMDRVTIYRVLNRFCEDGITHRIVSDEGKYYFALCHGCSHDKHAHDHYHFRCLDCHTVECLKERVVVNVPEGYRIATINSWVTGYCCNCT